MQIPLKFPEVDRDKTMLERDKKKKKCWCYAIHSVLLRRAKNISKVFNKDTWFYFFNFKGSPEQRNYQ